MPNLRCVLSSLGLCVLLAPSCSDDGDSRPGPDTAGSAGGSANGGTTAAGGQAGEGSGASSGAGAGAQPTTAGGTAGSGGAGGSGLAGEGGAGTVSRVDVATYCVEAAAAYYEWLRTCYGTEAYPAEERAAFVERHRPECVAAADSVEAGRLAFDGIAAGACLELLDVPNCDGFDFILGIEDCQDLFTPLVDSGEECFPGATRHFTIMGAASECSEGYCDTTGQSCPGECVPFKANDEACTLSEECLPESRCTDEVCVPRSEDGEPCPAGETCLKGSSCIVAADASEGICVPRSERGQACSESAPCSAGFSCLGGECLTKVDSGEPCLNHSNCSNDERCLDRDGAGAAGPSCGPRGGAQVPCTSPSDCDADHYCPNAAPSSCTARPTRGASCDAEHCEAGAWCNLETLSCEAPGSVGDSCLMNGFPGPNSACEGELYCMANGECHPPGAADEPCHWGDYNTCETGLFCSRQTFTCQALAGVGDFCNPFWPSTCEAALGCLCVGDACEPHAGAPNVHDTLHVCGSLKVLGDACFRNSECADAGTCQGEPPTCQAPWTDCLPT